MKEIKDMNLAELADRLESDEDIYHDEYVFVERLRELHDLTRWIPVSERMPTEEDGYRTYHVLVIWDDGQITQLPWGVVSEYVGDECHFPNTGCVTHWRKITPPEGV